jgi:hypothetical protein
MKKIFYKTSGEHRGSQKLKDYGYDNVLPGQGYRTLQRAVTDGYATMVE